MDLDVGITFIVLETNVVLGAIFLDEVHLKDERLKFRADQNPLDIGYLPHQPPGFRVMAGIRVEVRPHAVLKVDGFTHINDGPVFIAVNITTRFCGKGRQSPQDFF